MEMDEICVDRKDISIQTIYDEQEKCDYIKTIIEETCDKVQLKATEFELFNISQLMHISGMDEADVKAIVELAVYNGPIKEVQTAKHFGLELYEEIGFKYVPCLCPSPVRCRGKVTTFEGLDEKDIIYPQLHCYQIEKAMEDWMAKKEKPGMQYKQECESEFVTIELKDIKMEKPTELAENVDKCTNTYISPRELIHLMKQLVKDSCTEVSIKSSDYEAFITSTKMIDAGIEEEDWKKVIDNAVQNGPVKDVESANHFVSKETKNGFKFEPCHCPSTVVCGGKVINHQDLRRELLSCPHLSCIQIKNELDKFLEKRKDGIVENPQLKEKRKMKKLETKNKKIRRVKLFDNTLFTANIIVFCFMIFLFIWVVIKNF